MRHLLLALPFALLPLALANAQSHEHDHTEHGSLDKHEHGVASLNVALDGSTLEIQLESPAMNLVGFEHAASSAADQAKVAAVRQQLEQPQALFALPIEAKCTLKQHELQGALFAAHADEHEHEHEHEHDEHAAHEPGEEQGHSDISAHYQFDCATPAALQTLELGSFFGSFPGTEKLDVQLIGPSGQQGAQLSPGNTRLTF
ncbi:DUF2796 domain-containing protein [Aquipseudomonas guryensis]|uniref:DUF2796 domain-containing protein n=1 Tax=Aquipseudomonas guryensis TaxID=2759165 RepID=A0A7W4DDF9_9GAMM|nr:DUF2796 domain-containing protein [Pseudomonas guryensis]MBB1520505.1 DUF2796 domain-containing protein [Pseudomonas guryensis]